MFDLVSIWILLVAAMWLPLHWIMFWPLLKVEPVSATVLRIYDKSYGERREYDMLIRYSHDGIYHEVEIENLSGDDRPGLNSEMLIWRHPFFEDLFTHEAPTFQSLFLRSWRHFKGYLPWFTFAYAGYSFFIS